MELVVSTESGAKLAGQVQLSDQVFAKEFKSALIHQVVTAYLAGGRLGTKAQKTRSQVRGGGKKPWKQKGTGNARAGTIRSPLWRGGGVIFAATPRDFSQKVNRKMYRAAIRSIFSELIRQNRLMVVDELVLSTPKTKELIVKLQNFQIIGKIGCLIITEQVENYLALAARNLPHIAVLAANKIDPVNLIKYDNILITKQAIENINKALL